MKDYSFLRTQQHPIFFTTQRDVPIFLWLTYYLVCSPCGHSYVERNPMKALKQNA